MIDRSNDNVQRLEEIVAYLDGELSAEESAQVERRLASDESYRRQLQSIERAWSALDELPLAVVDDRFSRTTMEIAVKVAAREVEEKTTALPVQRRRLRLSALLAASAAAALGFLVVRLAWPASDRMLTADLPVIDHLDVYTQFETPEFLRSLRRTFGDDLEELGVKSAVVAERADRLREVSQPPRRRAWLSGLSDEERTALRAKFNRFRQLQPDEQGRLRALHEEIAAASDAETLRETMLTYSEWLGGLPPARQYELRTMPIEQRVQTIGRWADQMRDDALLTLSDEELQQFVRKIRGPRDQFLRDAAKRFRQGEDNRNPGRPHGLGFNQLSNALAMQWPAGLTQQSEFHDAVLEALPARTREAFESLPPRQKVERFMAWMRQGEALRGEVTQEALERFFAEELDAETRAELLSLPPSEMEQALRRLYRYQPGRGPDRPWAWGRDGAVGEPGGRRRGRHGPPPRGLEGPDGAWGGPPHWQPTGPEHDDGPLRPLPLHREDPRGRSPGDTPPPRQQAPDEPPSG